MPQVENGQEKENNDALRRFIDRLEDWPDDNPPTPAELRALRREIRLTEDERDKLELLAENHIRRARSALAGRSFDLAVAELARASQLRPLDPRPRVELAGIFLQRSLERGYGRNDRVRAVRLARKALELNPGDHEARRFLQEYRRMNADFMAVKIRRFIVPAIIFLILLIAMSWWQREWVMNLFQRNTDPVINSASSFTGGTPESRSVEVDAGGLSGGSMNLDIISASVGRRNDASYVEVMGRLLVSDRSLGTLKLLIRGRDEQGNTAFSLPWTVRDQSSPILLPGDTQSLAVFRWLADSEENIRSLEIVPFEMDLPENPPRFTSQTPAVVWDSARPDGAAVEAEIRGFRSIEAYDRQVLLMDLALKNTGIVEIKGLNLGVSIGPDLPDYNFQAVNPVEPPIIRGERRVWPVIIGVPLDTDLSGRLMTLRIRDTVE